MKRSATPIEDTETFAELSALPEINAISRVGAMRIGSTFERARARQIIRDANRAQARGKPEKAEALRTKLRALMTQTNAIEVQMQREQVPDHRPAEGATIIQGRLAEHGLGKAGLRLDLVDKHGTSQGHTVTNAAGSFVLQAEKAAAADLRLVVSDGTGGILKDAPLAKTPTGFLELDVAKDTATKTPKVEPTAPASPPKTVTVPQLKSLTVADALISLTGANLDAKAVDIESDSYAKGIVVKHTPAAAETVPRDSVITLFVSTGPKKSDPVKPSEDETYTTPTFIGSKFADVAAQLKQHDLSIGTIKYARKPVNAGQILDQDPAAKAPLNKTRTIDLTVGTGKAKPNIDVFLTSLAFAPEIRKAKLTQDHLSALQSAAKLTTAKRLATVSEMDPANLQAMVPALSDPQAKALHAAIQRISKAMQ